MIVKALETKYCQIYGRDALILTGTELNLYPFNFTIKASLSLSACKPAIKDAYDVSLEVFISKIEKLSIYKVYYIKFRFSRRYPKRWSSAHNYQYL